MTCVGHKTQVMSNCCLSYAGQGLGLFVYNLWNHTFWICSLTVTPYECTVGWVWGGSCWFPLESLEMLEVWDCWKVNFPTTTGNIATKTLILTADKEKLSLSGKSYCCKEKIIVANEKLLLSKKSYCCKESYCCREKVIVAYKWQLWATVTKPVAPCSGHVSWMVPPNCWIFMIHVTGWRSDIRENPQIARPLRNQLSVKAEIFHRKCCCEFAGTKSGRRGHNYGRTDQGFPDQRLRTSGKLTITENPRQLCGSLGKTKSLTMRESVTWQRKKGWVTWNEYSRRLQASLFKWSEPERKPVAVALYWWQYCNNTNILYITYKCTLYRHSGVVGLFRCCFFLTAE